MNSQFIEQWKKHIPWVIITENNLEISIGYDLVHPMIEQHYISSIDILEYTKAWLLRKKEILLHPNQEPKVVIPLSDLGNWTFRIQARCNLHCTFETDIVL